jgi:DNA adenine methylase
MEYKPIKPCFPWFGGKQKLVSKLVSLIPEHRSYVEPFGGAGSLLLAKEPSPIEVYNDIDEDLVNFFQILRDREQFKEFRRLIDLTIYSRKNFYEFKKEIKDKLESDPISRACKWFSVARQSFSGIWGNSWSHSIHSSSNCMSKCTSAYLSAIKYLPELVERIKRVLIENKDFAKLIKRFDNKRTFFYCDPPYLPSTRRGGQYLFEMDEKDHERLIKILLNLEGKAMLSGYQNPLYNRLEEAGWRRQEFKLRSSVSGNTLQQLGRPLDKNRVDSVWMNYEISASQN